MKYCFSVFLSALMLSLASAASFAQKPVLPELSFADVQMQKLADQAAEAYQSPDVFSTFERDLNSWKGRQPQLMMLNYIMIVNNIMSEQAVTDDPKTDYTTEEAITVQTAMFEKYLEARGIVIPKDFVERFNLMEEQVEALSGELEYMQDGPQFQLNQHAFVTNELKKFLALQLGWTLIKKKGESEVQGFLSGEEIQFEQFLSCASYSKMNYEVIKSGGGMYFSMLPLIVSYFENRLLGCRILSLKRVAGLLGIADFGNVPFPDDLPPLAPGEPEKSLKAYGASLPISDIENEQVVKSAEDAFDKAMDAYTFFMEARKELADYIPDSGLQAYNKDTETYRALMLLAHVGEGVE